MHVHRSAAILPPLVGVLLATSSCSTPAQPANLYQRVVGFIDPLGSPIRPLTLPDTVRAGATVTATVTTFGSSCIKPDGATTTIGVARADITPYDLVPLGACVTDIGPFPRPVLLQFPAPGVVTVTLHGRGPTGPDSVSRSLVVQP